MQNRKKPTYTPKALFIVGGALVIFGVAVGVFNLLTHNSYDWYVYVGMGVVFWLFAVVNARKT